MTLPWLAPPTCKTATRVSRRTSAAAFEGSLPDADDPLLGFAPYVHQAPRRNSITPERQRAFIAALAASGVVTQAARRIGASLEALYTLRNRKGAEGFAAAWEEALDRGLGRLQDCALERAIQGEERLIVARSGEVAARWTRYDTTLITFLLRQRHDQRAHHRDLRPGNPVYDRLKREWEEERQREEEQRLDEMTEENDRFLTKLNRRLGQIRDEAIAAGVMVLDETGHGTFVGLDDDDACGEDEDRKDEDREDEEDSPITAGSDAGTSDIEDPITEGPDADDPDIADAVTEDVEAAESDDADNANPDADDPSAEDVSAEDPGAEDPGASDQTPDEQDTGEQDTGDPHTAEDDDAGTEAISSDSSPDSSSD